MRAPPVYIEDQSGGTAHKKANKGVYGAGNTLYTLGKGITMIRDKKTLDLSQFFWKMQS